MSNDNGYRFVQLTNNAIGPVAADAVLPIGVENHGIACGSSCVSSFDVSTTANNVAKINRPGYYKITYSGYLTAAAAGAVVVNLEVNGVVVATGTTTAAAAGDTVAISLTFAIRILNNCCNSVTSNTPQNIQFRNASLIALTGGNSNVLIERTADN